MADQINEPSERDLYENKDQYYYQHARPELLPFIPLNIQTALDVGCGSGNFGEMLKHKFDCEVWGIEINKEAALAASAKIDRVINEPFTATTSDLADKKFDAIFFNDVLEHLPDPEGALVHCRQLLNPNGCIIASIPNIRWYPVILSLLRYKDFKYEVSGVMDKTHLKFFTLKSMRRMFEDAGYRVLKTEGINKDGNYRYFNILNFLLFNSQWDMKYPQFVVIADNPL